MALDIYQKNVRSWVTLILSTPKSGLLRNACGILHIGLFVGKNPDKNAIFQHAVDKIILQEKEKKVWNMKHMRTLMMKSMNMICMILIK